MVPLSSNYNFVFVMQAISLVEGKYSEEKAAKLQRLDATSFEA